jgi:hypothetical protein
MITPSYHFCFPILPKDGLHLIFVLFLSFLRFSSLCYCYWYWCWCWCYHHHHHQELAVSKERTGEEEAEP